MKKPSVLSAYPMEELSGIICEFVEQGKEVVFTAKGHSMRPLLRSDKDQVILKACNPDALGDGEVILYRRDSGGYVIHRIVSRNKNGTYNLMGDSQTQLERGIRPNQILAVACGFIIKNREIASSGKKYTRYVSFWSRSKTIRRLYIVLFYGFMRLRYLAAAAFRKIFPKKQKNG